MVAVHLFLHTAYSLPMLGDVASIFGNGISILGNVAWNGLETHELATQKVKEVSKLAKISFGISAGFLFLGHLAYRYRKRREKRLIERLSGSLIMNKNIETTFIPRVIPSLITTKSNPTGKPSTTITNVNVPNMLDVSNKNKS